MGTVVPFPLVRRSRLIARKSKPGEQRHYLRVQARMLQRTGIGEDEILRQLRALWATAQCGPPNRTGGAA